jgi:hypothetical protein
VSSTDVGVVNPATGELLERLDAQPAEALVDALVAIRERRAALREAEDVVEVELRRRMDLRGRKLAVIGPWEVEVASGNVREWDADALEGVLRELIDDGVVHAAEVTEVIRHETTVSGREALRIAGRLSGPAKAAVERCFVWRKKGGGRLRIERSVELLPAPEERTQ